MAEDLDDWRKKHKEVIQDFLVYLNRKTDSYILKGGTSLMMCYGLDRFSEDIDFDSLNHNRIRKEVENFCNAFGYGYRVAKATNTVQRLFIHYGNEQHPLKIEVSYRKREFDKDQIAKINGISVYNINEIFSMKLNAYMGRSKIRDLYDVVFIAKRYWNELVPINKNAMTNALSIKGLEYFDYIIQTQSDELINSEKLADDFLDVCDMAGVIVEDLTENLEDIDEISDTQDGCFLNDDFQL